MYVLTLLLLINSVKAYTIVNPFGPTVSSDYANCITELIDDNFKKPGVVLVANTYNATTHVVRIREEILKYLHDQFIYSIRTENLIAITKDCEDKIDDCNQNEKPKMDKFAVIRLANYYVIIVDSYTEYKNIVDKIITLRSWNPRAYFIVLCFRLVNIQELIIKRYPERILTYLFKHNAINVVVMIPDQENYRNGILYGWRPFDPPRYCGYHNETADDRLIIENICKKGKLTRKRKLFENRVPTDETGCYLDIVALERTPFVSSNPDDPSLEKIVLQEIISLLKFKPNYKITNSFRGEKDERGVWTGALTHIVEAKSDILIGGIFPDDDVHEDFDSSTAYLTNSYTWVVPRAQKSAPWIALIIIFNKYVWLTASATFLVCSIAWKVIAILSHDTNYHKNISHCLLNTLYSSLGFASYMRPVKQSLRIFFIFLSLYCILFLTAYQTKLIDVLTHPSFEKQIETIEELVESDLLIGGTEELHDLFVNSTDPFDYEIGDVWIDVDDVEIALKDVVVHRNFSILISHLELTHYSAIMPELSDDFGNPTYYEFETTVFSVPLEIVTLRGFPFLDKFNYYLSIFKQCGTFERIKAMFKNLTKIRKAILLNNINSAKSNENALSLLHLEGGFLALAVGYVSGTIILIIEIIVHTRYFQKKMLHIVNYLQRFKIKTKKK